MKRREGKIENNYFNSIFFSQVENIIVLVGQFSKGGIVRVRICEQEVGAAFILNLIVKKLINVELHYIISIVRAEQCNHLKLTQFLFCILRHYL